ncbi:hypothetical protein [uncultured Bradyrhizobium sp.]|jgi:hypothetical protein|uniref:tetratricopeptide repeat protein n=1 Tax=uncultured Bradyrhizobium sp. TaxID=199684 RepID=UPI00260483E3|nr:hypothetical protein [uncultured Bradyrhizobium sp.]
MVSFDSIDIFHDWIKDLRRKLPLPDVIRAVAERLVSVKGDDLRYLSHELVWLLREEERDIEAIDILEDMLRCDPRDVRPAITKANIYFVSLDQPIDALKAIDAALERANATGLFRREALGTKARILVKLGRGDELSDVLEEIMSLQMIPGVPDIGRERDFVDSAPPGLIRKSVLDRYNEFRPRRPEDGSGDEPPPYEPADDRM